jgi:hypothetical protein
MCNRDRTEAYNSLERVMPDRRCVQSDYSVVTTLLRIRRARCITVAQILKACRQPVQISLALLTILFIALI